MCDCYSNGSSPHVGIIDNKSSEKILVFPGGRSVFQANSDDFIARASGSVPRSMLGREIHRPYIQVETFCRCKMLVQGRQSGLG